MMHGMEPLQPIFDPARVKAHRARSAAACDAHDFLLHEMASRIAERLLPVKRQFPRVLEIGARQGVLAGYVQGQFGIVDYVQAELSQPLLARAKGARVVASPEWLPFADDSMDMVVSIGSLHWVNDLAGTLIQIRRILKPDGLFLAMMPGGQTLQELRASLEHAELAARGGLSPRISPFIDVRDAGSLLQRAGFAMPVVDGELLDIHYAHPLKLMRELRGMGESNALLASSKGFTPCSLMMQAVDHYMQHFAVEEGRVQATIELVTLTGWKPHASQQQPAKRGSGTVPLGQVFE
jgi:NADH dehydrogenase [ubiquinone] 1 alpha subcomplex assembly factor 5